MAISQKKYVDITSQVGGRNAVSRRELMGLIFSSDKRAADLVSFDGHKGIYEFASATEVYNVFKSRNAPEYVFAKKYFDFISKSITRAAHLKIAYWRNDSDINSHAVAYKGEKATNAQLPTSGNTDGDWWKVTTYTDLDGTVTKQARCVWYNDAWHKMLSYVSRSTVAPYNSDRFDGLVEFKMMVEQVPYSFKIKFVARAEEVPAGADYTLCINPTITSGALNYTPILAAVNDRIKHLYVNNDGEVERVADADIETVDKDDCYDFLIEEYQSDNPTTSRNERRYQVSCRKADDSTCEGDNIKFMDGFEMFGLGSFSAPTEERNESPIEAIMRIDEIDDNFGSFLFLDKLEDQDVLSVSQWVDAKNYKYLYSVSEDYDTLIGANGLADKLMSAGYSGTVVTETPLGKRDEFTGFIPMVLFASTNYKNVNATKNFMFQQFNGELATVDSLDLATTHDTRNVNYVGCTQQAGKIARFYQDGFNSDGTDTGVYCNEVWFKDAVAAEFLNLFLTEEKVEASTVGEAVCRTHILTVIQEAMDNGTIVTGKNLSTIQKMYIDNITGEANSWKSVQTDGYWLGIRIEADLNDTRSSKYVANYTLIYSKGDSIRKVEGRNILI